MNLGNNLFNARKKSGYSQENVAEKLGVSRQTISKWETGETLPDIQQSKRLSVLYGLTLDDLIEFDIDVKEIEQVIERTTEETQAKVDWNKVWSKKYPILSQYKDFVDVKKYSNPLREQLNDLEKIYGFNSTDSLLVLKDILANEWKKKK